MLNSTKLFRQPWALLRMVVFLGLSTGSLLAQDELRKSASWTWPEPVIYEEQLRSYLDQRQADAQTRTRVEENWRETSAVVRGPQLLDRLLTTAGMIEPRIHELVLRLKDLRSDPVHPGGVDWLTSDVPGWMQDTIRLACGRSFAQRKMYDEALETLAGLELIQVCDPSSLIFYRATCEHHLMKQASCLRNIDLLLEREEELPARYAQVATLMRADIAPMEADSLDEVARLMRDVERRLELGRAGARVRTKEDEIVQKLDKLIEDLEQQAQQQQQSQANGGTDQQGQNQPMQDSQIAGGSGAGDIDQKDVGQRAGWGNLPPAERQEALQRLTEELPSHYRSVIEGYFRKLAEEDG